MIFFQYYAFCIQNQCVFIRKRTNIHIHSHLIENTYTTDGSAIVVIQSLTFISASKVWLNTKLHLRIFEMNTRAKQDYNIYSASIVAVCCHRSQPSGDAIGCKLNWTLQLKKEKMVDRKTPFDYITQPI